MISRAEVPAGVSDNRDVELLQRLKDIFPEPIFIRERVSGVIDAAVNASTHVPISESMTYSDSDHSIEGTAHSVNPA